MSSKRIRVAWLAGLISLLGSTALAQNYTLQVQDATPSGPVTDSPPYGTVSRDAYFEKETTVINLNDAMELEEYRQGRLDALAAMDDNDWSFATLTFTTPLDRSALDSAVTGVNIMQLKYISYPEGVGTVGYRDDPAETDFVLQKLQDYIGPKMEELNGISDFRICDGYIAAVIQGSGAALNALRMESDIYLVDLQTRPVTDLDVYFHYQSALP